MKSVIRALLLGVALLANTAPASAERVEFAGTLDASAAAVFGGTNVYLLANFTPGVGTSATVVAGNVWAISTLVVGTKTFNLAPSGTFNKITVKDGATRPGGNSNEDYLSLGFRADTVGGQFPDDAINGDINLLQLEVLGKTNVPLVASAANIYSLAAYGNTVQGTFTLASVSGNPGGTFTFTGTVVPEPSSIALLSGLGLVVAGRVWKRRAARKQSAA
jgi:hypothetical protein